LSSASLNLSGLKIFHSIEEFRIFAPRFRARHSLKISSDVAGVRHRSNQINVALDVWHNQEVNWKTVEPSLALYEPLLLSRPLMILIRAVISSAVAKLFLCRNNVLVGTDRNVIGYGLRFW